MTGHLVAPKDMYGCSVIDPPTKEKDWIALLERGQCSFIDKVRAMQSSGAIAVVVGDRYLNSFVTMYAPGKIIIIIYF
jgi:E3 ubiquitin-protein ligase RNF13